MGDEGGKRGCLQAETESRRKKGRGGNDIINDFSAILNVFTDLESRVFNLYQDTFLFCITKIHDG